VDLDLAVQRQVEALSSRSIFFADRPDDPRCQQVQGNNQATRGKLGGGLKYVLFSPRNLGKMIQFD